MQSLYFYVKQLDDLEDATTVFDKEIQKFRDRYDKVVREHHSLYDEVRAFLKTIREQED